MVDFLSLNDPIHPAFEPFWFNSEEYASAQKDLEGASFYYKKEATEIFIRLYHKEGWLVSPARAPFGAFEISSETDLKTFYEFVKELVDRLKDSGVKGIKITAAPECYDLSKADLLDEALIHAGFSTSVTELNYHLDTEMGAFESFIHDSEKRRLKKCLNAGFQVSVETNPDYTMLHRLISDCRMRKGHPLSMNAQDFEKMFLDFPGRYLVFVVKDKEVTIAAAVGVKVHSTVLYNFLPADHEAYLGFSPMVLLNKGMYEFCQQNNYSLYDLGIATAGGLRNEGLIRFKEHLGGMLSHKYTYEITF